MSKAAPPLNVADILSPTRRAALSRLPGPLNAAISSLGVRVTDSLLSTTWDLPMIAWSGALNAIFPFTSLLSARSTSDKAMEAGSIGGAGGAAAGGAIHARGGFGALIVV